MLISADFLKDRNGENEIIVEEVIWFFEDAWKKGDRPIVEDYLPANRAARWECLKELVCVDLERRLKAGESCGVESYSARFPELALDADVVCNMVALEFQIRKRTSPDVTVHAYLERFPQFAERLATDLASSIA